MKRRIRFTALLLILVMTLSCAMEAVLADTEVQVRLKPSYQYNEARKMLKLINKFRTGKNAWQWSKDNKTKTKVKGLGKLEYDYNLERVAMQRALEIAVYFSHTRPNNSAWSTLYPKGYKARGENVAYGFGSASAAFDGFAEEDKDYAGQGHRRNMLNKRYTRVGIGAVRIGNMMYWVQEFGTGGSKGSDNKRYSSDKVMVSTKILKKVASKVEPAEEKITVQVGSTVNAPGVVVYSASGAKMTLEQSSWKVKDSSKAKVKNKKVTGVEAGKTKMMATVAGSSVSLSVNVVTAAVATEAPVSPSDEELTELDDYDTPLGTDFLILLEDDECFEEVEDEEPEE